MPTFEELLEEATILKNRLRERDAMEAKQAALEQELEELKRRITATNIEVSSKKLYLKSELSK